MSLYEVIHISKSRELLGNLCEDNQQLKLKIILITIEYYGILSNIVGVIELKYIDPMIFDDKDMQIIFKPLNAFGINPSNYLISNYGHIYSIRSDKILKSQLSTAGYYYTACGANTRIYNHRAVAGVYVNGYNNNSNCVNHKNGDKLDNYYKNLEWVTKAENNTHAYATGLNNYIGENCKDSKLTNDQVRYICKLMESGYDNNSIVRMLGLEENSNNYEIIRSIRKGYAWRSISSDYNIPQSSYSYRSISKDDVEQICKNFESGMSIPECYETIYHTKFPGVDKCRNEYTRLMHIKNHKIFTDISKKYNF